ncbi:MAG: polysaccharide pyruvyl transferase family protein, partial [Phycisphaerae bacterium]
MLIATADSERAEIVWASLLCWLVRKLHFINNRASQCHALRTFGRVYERLCRHLAECDFLLHGSGPSLVAQNDVARWAKETGKPYGIYGITLPLQGSTATSPTSDKSIAATVELLSGAKFVYFRDSKSLEFAKQRGCASPLMEYGPDGAFATDLRDDAKATAFLKANGLEDGQFLCCIPRLRFTPYWTIHKE